MDAIRRMALGLCVLSAVGGILQIFWPDNSYKPVINTVLVLYIVASVFQMRPNAEMLPNLHWEFRQQTPDTAQYQQYTESLVWEASAQALQDLLQQAGIAARVQLDNGTCRIYLQDPQQRDKAAQLIQDNRGSLPCELLTEEGAP